ncbi:hypothetical protein FB45DRAFT_730675, partial [Roridomyces roridus]
LLGSFTTFLDNYHLRFVYRLPIDTKIVELIQVATNDMKNSSSQWRFSEPSSSLTQYLHPNETLHLQLLRMSNRGLPRKSDGLIILTRQPVDHQLTLAHLFANPYKVFVKPGLGIRDSRLVLNFGQWPNTSFPATVNTLGTLRRHSCIGQRMHSLFSADHECGANTSSWTAPQCESEDDHEAELSEVEDTSTPISRSATTPTHAAPVSRPSLPTDSTADSTRQPISVTPPRLWATHWTPAPGRYSGRLFEATIFSKALFETATGTLSNPAKLVISGEDFSELAQALIKEIKLAAIAGDFTKILSSDRSFDRTQGGLVVSTGTGIEKETIYTAYRFFTDHEGAWFFPRFGNKSSIATTMSLAGSSFISTDRRLNLVVLGCLTSLMLIHGLAPDPISPALIQWAINGCDVHSLTRDFVGEWFPELRALLDDWTDCGPGGDLEPFQTHLAIYHDMQVASLRTRDLVHHQAFALDMVYTALISTQPAQQSELSSFVTGVRLGCRNGFDFPEVVRSYTGGGSATFISRIWTSLIHDFATIQPYLSIFGLTSRQLSNFADSASSIQGMDLCDLLRKFLQGSGAPCRRLLDQAIPHLSKLIRWEEIDEAAFRPKLFCYAVTGSPHVEWADVEQQMVVHWVGPNDTAYYDDPIARARFMQYGQIAFRTCFKTVRIPAMHLIHLCNSSYPAHDDEGNEVEPFTRDQAIEHWLMMQFAGAIGGATYM